MVADRDKSKPLILIVEDSADARELLRTMISMMGYKTVEAENGLEAITAANNYRPDLIIMDMNLPELDGFWAAKIMRQTDETKDIPIIACTSFNKWEWRAKAIASHCNDFISKPVEFDDIKNIVLTYLLKAK